MADRPRELVLQLERRGTWMTASMLADVLGCTARTVKSTVSSLNDQYPDIIVSSVHGYRLGKSAIVESYLSSQTHGHRADAPQTVQERRTRILCQLLMHHAERSVYDLSEELCISSVTLENEIRALNIDLADANVSLKMRGGMVYVAGDEADKKRVISDLLFNETRHFFNQLELVNEYFPEVDIKGLREEIETHLKRNGYYINGYSMSNLILHLAIALERRLNAFPVTEAAYGAKGADISTSTERVANEIIEAIDAHYHIELTQQDRRAFTLILSTCLVETESLKSNCLFDERVKRLVDHICSRLETEFAIDLSDGEFLVRFALHLENLLARGERDVVLRNPQLGLIKNAYPYVYEIAVFIAEIIQNETQMTVSEDEIAFIALHVGCFIEEQSERNARLRAVLVSPCYNGRAASLAQRLGEDFPKDLVVEAVVESLDEIKMLAQADIIVSTQELSGSFGAPVVRISPYLGEMDRALIRARIDGIRGERRQRSMERNLHTFFRSDLFFIDSGFENESDAIETMGSALVEGGFAFPDFKERLYDREAISSSAYRNIALPHPIDMDARRTAVAVSLHPEPIMWMGEQVNVVFMLAVTRADRSFFRELFEFMAHVLNEPGSVQALSRTRDFEEFVKTLLKYY